MMEYLEIFARVCCSGGEAVSRSGEGCGELLRESLYWSGTKSNVRNAVLLPQSKIPKGGGLGYANTLPASLGN
jgi:hypothetical protein